MHDPAGFLYNGVLPACEKPGLASDRMIGTRRRVVTRAIEPAG